MTNWERFDRAARYEVGSQVCNAVADSKKRGTVHVLFPRGSSEVLPVAWHESAKGWGLPGLNGVIGFVSEDLLTLWAELAPGEIITELQENRPLGVPNGQYAVIVCALKFVVGVTLDDSKKAISQGSGYRDSGDEKVELDPMVCDEVVRIYNEEHANLA